MVKSADKMEQFSLESLLSPLAPEHFFANYLDRLPCLFKRNGSNWDGLFSLEELAVVIASQNAGTVSLCRDGEIRLAPLSGKRARVNVDAVMRAFQDGYTIRLIHLERIIPAFAALRLQLEKDFNRLGLPLVPSGGSVLFLTPPGAIALKPHNDEDDVLVLQIAGSKIWRFFGESPKAHYRHTWDVTGLPTQEIRIDRGDLLYIPRGFIHQAETSNDLSLAISVGFRTYSWRDIANELFSRALPNTIEKTVPPEAFSKGKLSAKGLTLLGQWLDANLSGLTQAFSCGPEQGPSLFDLEFALQLRRLGPNTMLSRFCAGSLIPDEQAIALHFGEKRIRFPPNIGGTLEAIVAMEGPFCQEMVPGQTSSTLVVLERLLHEKFLVFYDDSGMSSSA